MKFAQIIKAYTQIKKARENFKYFLPLAFQVVNPGKKFLANWHLEVICHYLEEVYKGNIKRLIINMPPRALKSLTINVAWLAWLMGKDPTIRIISASYSQHLSIKHALDSKFLINSKFFNLVFPELILHSDQNKKEKFTTTKQGFRFSTSIGGSVTGEGGNILILDDPHNAMHVNSLKRREFVINWFKQSFASRLDNKKDGKIILVMQRLHPEDLTGFLLKNQQDNWVHLNIPAIASKTLYYNLGKEIFIFKQGEYLHPEREDKEELARAKQELGDTTFSAQYLQKPLQKNSGIIHKSWFCYYESISKIQFSSIIISWDTAIKTADNNSYSVATCWGEYQQKYYLLDLIRDKLEYPFLKKAVINFAQKWQADLVLIEDKASGQSLIQDLKYQPLKVIAIGAYKDKIIRFARVSQLFENRAVYLPKNAWWRYDYEEELLSFPSSKASDQVDSTSQYLNFMLKKLCHQPSFRRI